MNNQNTTALEVMLRTDGSAATRHMLLEGAPESFCGIDRTILTDGAEIAAVMRAENCAACKAGAQRAMGLGHYLRKQGVAA